MNKKIDIRFVSVAFLVIAVALRFMPHYYNVSAVGALGMFVGCFWSLPMGILMALAAMGVSDLFAHWAGVHSMGAYDPTLMLFVYFAIACSALVGRLLKGRVSLASVPLAAIATTLAFFLLTNFASWLDPLMAYERTLSGLMRCYYMAIPFAQNTLIGNVLYSALFLGSYAILTAPKRSRATLP